MEIVTPCKVVGRACMHRPHSGLSASPSCAPLRTSNSFSVRLSSSCKFSNSTVLEMLVARIAQEPFSFKPWLLPPPRVRERKQRLLKRFDSPLKFRRGEIGYSGRSKRAAIGMVHGFDDFSAAMDDVYDGQGGRLAIGKTWDPLKERRFVEERERIGGVDSLQNCSLSKTRSTFFAAISAQRYQPPVQVPVVRRSQVSSYVTGGVLLSVSAWILWVLTKTEQYARQALVAPEETLVTPPPAPEMVEQYERAKASVAQAALVNDALAAVRNNDLIKCTVEMELALEENRVARSSIESDFFDEGELLQVYRGVLKMWLDGYPLDYGKILQLRGLLDISSKEADEIEQEVQQQSDAYVI